MHHFIPLEYGCFHRLIRILEIMASNIPFIKESNDLSLCHLFLLKCLKEIVLPLKALSSLFVMQRKHSFLFHEKPLFSQVGVGDFSF